MLRCRRCNFVRACMVFSLTCVRLTAWREVGAVVRTISVRTLRHGHGHKQTISLR